MGGQGSQWRGQRGSRRGRGRWRRRMRTRIGMKPRTGRWHGGHGWWSCTDIGWHWRQSSGIWRRRIGVGLHMDQKFFGIAKSSSAVIGACKLTNFQNVSKLSFLARKRNTFPSPMDALTVLSIWEAGLDTTWYKLKGGSTCDPIAHVWKSPSCRPWRGWGQGCGRRCHSLVSRIGHHGLFVVGLRWGGYEAVVGGQAGGGGQHLLVSDSCGTQRISTQRISTHTRSWWFTEAGSKTGQKWVRSNGTGWAWRWQSNWWRLLIHVQTTSKDWQGGRREVARGHRRWAFSVAYHWICDSDFGRRRPGPGLISSSSAPAGLFGIGEHHWAAATFLTPIQFTERRLQWIRPDLTASFSQHGQGTGFGINLKKF